MSDFPPLLVVRRARLSETAWADAPSWFGGLPRLGRQAWPRNSRTGKPHVFAAQIDLAELSQAHNDPRIPTDGSLAFFIDGDGAVVHVPAGADRTPTRLPEDATPAYEPSGDLFPQKPSLWARPIFPYWPVEFARIDITMPGADVADDDRSEIIWRAMGEAVHRMVAPREYFFSAKEGFKAIGGEAPLWWHAAQSYAEYLRIALFHVGDIENARRPWHEKARTDVKRLTPKPVSGVFGKRAAPDEALGKALKDLERLDAQEVDYRRQRAGFDGFLAEVEKFAAGHDPWRRMSAYERSDFEALFARGRKEFADIVRYRTPGSIEELQTGTILAMATGDSDAYRAMPSQMRDFINNHYRLPPKCWHQMFGVGIEIQGNAAWENEGKIMLLQLIYDDVTSWVFGDMGAFQFWISPEDLAARNWNRATCTFECS